MEPIVYSYSKPALISGAAVIFIFFMLTLFGVIFSYGDQRLLAIGGIVVLMVISFYFYRSLFGPMVRNEVILEIDEEKVVYYPRNLELYWKEINDMDYGPTASWSRSRNAFQIRFTMKYGVYEMRIPTTYIAGEDGEIFDAIFNTFLKYR